MIRFDSVLSVIDERIHLSEKEACNYHVESSQALSLLAIAEALRCMVRVEHEKSKVLAGDLLVRDDVISRLKNEVFGIGDPAYNHGVSDCIEFIRKMGVRS